MLISMVIGKKTDFHDLVSSLPSLGDKHLGILLSSSRPRAAVSSLGTDDDIRYFDLGSLDPSSISDFFKDFGKDFKSVDIYSADKEVTLLPEGLFTEEHLDDCLDGVFGQSRRAVASSFIEALQLHSLFRIDADLDSTLRSSFPQRRFHHLIDTVITRSWVDRSFKEDYYFRLHIEDDIMFICVFRGKELRLFNTQSIRSAADIVYHMLNTIQAAEVDHVDAEVECSGIQVTARKGFELLKSYCPRTVDHYSVSGGSGEKDFILDNHRFCEL